MAKRDAAVESARARRAAYEAANPRPRAKTGRPRFEPTEQQQIQVAILASTATPQETIAMMIGVSLDTLRRTFVPELENGADRVNAGIKAAVTRKALAGDIPAVRLWARMWGGSEWNKAEGLYLPGNDQSPAVPVQPGESVVIVLPYNGRDTPPTIDAAELDGPDDIDG